MAEGASSKRLALDTNVLFDLAGGEDFAHDFRTAFQTRKYSLIVTETAIAELDHFRRAGDERRRQLAIVALQSLIGWDIVPVALSDVQRQYRRTFVNLVARRRILPPEEVNDARILAETAIAEAPILVTSDGPILNADLVALHLAFDDAGLPAVTPAHPRRLARSLR